MNALKVQSLCLVMLLSTVLPWMPCCGWGDTPAQAPQHACCAAKADQHPSESDSAPAQGPCCCQERIAIAEQSASRVTADAYALEFLPLAATNALGAATLHSVQDRFIAGGIALHTLNCVWRI